MTHARQFAAQEAELNPQTLRTMTYCLSCLCSHFPFLCCTLSSLAQPIWTSPQLSVSIVQSCPASLTVIALGHHVSVTVPYNPVPLLLTVIPNPFCHLLQHCVSTSTVPVGAMLLSSLTSHSPSQCDIPRLRVIILFSHLMSSLLLTSCPLPLVVFQPVLFFPFCVGNLCHFDLLLGIDGLYQHLPQLFSSVCPEVPPLLYFHLHHLNSLSVTLCHPY